MEVVPAVHPVQDRSFTDQASFRDLPNSPFTCGSSETAVTGYLGSSAATTPAVHEEDVDEILLKTEESEEVDLNAFDVATESPLSILPSPPKEEPDVKRQRLEQLTIKRSRGRPRKHPKEQSPDSAKALKGRSKTGCITCRRRKKKCDEAKPACQHCVKNNVHCEGYPPKDYWRSGKQKAIKRQCSNLESPRDLPVLFEGLEGNLDWELSDHFHFNVSRLLSFETNEYNPWTELIWPMARNSPGLMHALLSLSATHMLSRTMRMDVHERQLYHLDKTLASLRNSNCMSPAISPTEDEKRNAVDDSIIAQTLILCLVSMYNVETDDSYRYHLAVAKHFYRTNRARVSPFQKFFNETFLCLDLCNELTRPDGSAVLTPAQAPQRVIATEAKTCDYGGISGELLTTLCRIRNLRRVIRTRHSPDKPMEADYAVMSDAHAIDQALRAWSSPYPIQTAAWHASMFCRQSIWLFLRQTVATTASAAAVAPLHDAVEHALEYLRQLPEKSPAWNVLLLPMFLVGCAAHTSAQRDEIFTTFKTIQQHRGFANIGRTMKLLERLWSMSVNGEDVWDWEAIVAATDHDLLIA